MSLTSLDHCAIRTLELRKTRDFYVDLLGLDDGERPDFPFPGNWLYAGDTAVVHLVGIDPYDPSGLEEYLGAIDAKELHGSGSVDHLAFRADDPEALRARFKKAGLAFREHKVPGMDLFQIFVDDPNDITVELNFYGHAE